MTETRLSRAQATTIHTIASRGGEMNGWAGQPGFYCNNVGPLVRMGLIERVEHCAGCHRYAVTGEDEVRQCDRPLTGQRSGDQCYGRVRLTEDGWHVAHELDRAA